MKGRHPSPKVQAFVDFLVTLFPAPTRTVRHG
jgi:hypothetical protein